VSACDAIRRLAAIAACALLSAHASAQMSPSDAEIERAARTTPRITEQDIEAARRLHRTPSDAELARVPLAPAPKIDALPQPSARPKIDLESIAKGYQAIQRDDARTLLPSSEPRLLVFVSFSMPEATLARLADQAAAARASLVLRGLADGSLRQTVARVQRLMGSREIGFQIDPLAFDRFGITSVPSFVLLRRGAVPSACEAGTCFAADVYAKTAGDVSIRYAVEFISRTAPAFAGEAAFFLGRVKE
jgi:conjugal transfer pilus assembly protein TrbC